MRRHDKIVLLLVAAILLVYGVGVRVTDNPYWPRPLIPSLIIWLGAGAGGYGCSWLAQKQRLAFRVRAVVVVMGAIAGAMIGDMIKRATFG